jgi:hypothetical protein
MRPENWWAARAPRSVARLPPQNRARKLGDNFSFLKISRRQRLTVGSDCAAESIRLLACHNWERALEKSA